MTNRSLQQYFIHNPHLVYHRKQYWRLFTSGLIHANWLHLGINMFVFYVFAFLLEYRYLGDWQFAVVYVGSILFGSLPSLADHKNNPQYNTLGASGGVSGLLFSFVLFSPFETLYVFAILPMPAWMFAVLFVVYSYFAGRQAYDNVNHRAHLFGALAGALLTMIVRPKVFDMLEYYISQRLG